MAFAMMRWCRSMLIAELSRINRHILIDLACKLMKSRNIWLDGWLTDVGQSVNQFVRRFFSYRQNRQHFKTAKFSSESTYLSTKATTGVFTTQLINLMSDWSNVCVRGAFFSFPDQYKLFHPNFPTFDSQILTFRATNFRVFFSKTPSLESKV